MSNKKEKIVATILLTITFLAALIGTAFAKSYQIRPGAINEKFYPNNYTIDGKPYTIFCKEYLAMVGLGDVSDGQTEDDDPTTRENGDYLFTYNAPLYTSVGEYNLPKYIAYLLTETNDRDLEHMTWEERRQIQYAIWSDRTFNLGAAWGTSNAYKGMPSYMVRDQLQMQQIYAEKLIKHAENMESGLKTAQEELTWKITINYNNQIGPASPRTIKNASNEFVEAIKWAINASKSNITEQLNKAIEDVDFQKQIDAVREDKKRELENGGDAKEIAYLDEMLEQMEVIEQNMNNITSSINQFRRDLLSVTGGTDEEIGITDWQQGKLDQKNAEIQAMRFRDENRYDFIDERQYNLLLDKTNELNNYKYEVVGYYNNLISTVRQLKTSLTNYIYNIEVKLPELEKRAREEAKQAETLCTPLFAKAKLYEAFYKNYVSSDGTENGKDTNFPKNVEDLTNENEVKVLVDQNTQTYTIGPFSMKYPNQYYESVADNKRTYFDWIEDIYLVDKYGNKKENIQIVTEDKELGGPKNNVPVPKEKFWVKFENKADDGSDLDLDSIKVKVKFKYLRNCVGKYELYYGRGEQFDWILQSDPGDEDTEPKEWYQAFKKESDYNPQVQFAVEVTKMFFDFDDTNPDNSGYIANVIPTSVYDTCELELYAPMVPLEMEVGGVVFEDAAGTKEMVTNGIYVAENGDVLLPGIEVSLYEFENGRIGKLAELATEKRTTVGNENTIYEEKNRQNPTLTDENGRYLFKGVDPMKKYVVMFTYNGQTYMPVEYKVGSKGDLETEYDSVSENPGVQDEYNWRINSKSTETITDRNNFDNGFAQIGSSPSNYRIRTRALESSVLYDGNYNKTYSEYDLAGITLNADGKYEQTGPQLIDAYIETTSKEGTKIVGTKSSNKYRQGLITKKILEYMEREKKYPQDLKRDIYEPLVREIGGDTGETWRKLQFIEDCKINAYTGDIRNNNNSGLDVYPIYDRFVIDTKDYTVSYYHKDELNYKVGSENKAISRANTVVNNSGAVRTTEPTYKALYNGQYYLNLGLGRRQKFDAALRKDVFKATLQINGKTQVYDYNQREVDMITEAEKQELERLEKQYGRNSEQYLEYKTKVENDSEQGNRFWEIQARMLDYATYYDSVHNYNRELYKADYVYPGYPDSTGDGKLEAYVTYKITIRNQSQGILAKIDEVVDYYDNTYEPVWDKSWVMYKDRNTNNSEIKVTDQEFYDIMVGDRNVADGQKYRAVTSRTNQFESQYSKTTQFKDSFKTQGYDTIYVDGLKDKKLGTGESAYIYLTFKVKGSGNGLSLAEATTDPGKQNIAEINGYSTFYADQTELPNGITKNSGDVAGLIDIDSNAGNFTVDHLKNRAGNKKYEQNFEDDADRARGIKVFVQEGDNVLERKISGVAWEDKRDTLVEDALIGNGIRQDGEVKISGVKVELLEVKLDKDGKPSFDSNGDIITKGIAKYYDRDGNSHDATTVTSNNGEYTFVGIVPGDYIVRFTYGGGYTTKYNGQDYKTTTYQKGIEQAGRTDISKDADPGYVGYTNYGTYDDKGNNYAQNASGTYGYDINKADYNSSGNVSDAKDLWRLRAAVNNYSSTNYSGVINDKANTLDTDVANGNKNRNTQMIADTGVIRFEFEYNRQNSTQNSIDGQARSNNDYHGTQTGAENYEGANNGAQNQFNGVYHIKNVDLGLEERPKAGLELNKKVSNVKITLANQTVLFDASKSVSNLIWQAKSAYHVNDKKQISTYDNVAQRVTNGAKNVYSDYTRYTDLRNNINQDLIYGKVTKENGLIQATMDEELMHGATITITYDFTVSNMGEVDYKETNFYYTGKVANKDNNIVKTSADLVIDYVANNLQFRADNNDSKWGWNTIENKKITDNGYVNTDVAAELKNYNSIIITGALGKDANAANALIPLESTVNKNKTSHTQLVLSQLITSQNKNDDLSYNNIAEIVQISNDVGRRMAYSVQGNQKPSDLPKEADASKAEQVLILPPFGNGGTILYVALGSLVAAILAAGIVVIKKVVLKTKE